MPERDLATPEARGVLPETLTRADAVFNLGRMGLLVAGLADPASLRAGGHGRPHPPAGPHRAVPRGARAAARPWSSRRAGGQLVGRRADADRHRRGRRRPTTVRAGAEAALAASGVPGRVLVLRPDRRGIVYGDEAEVPL